MLDISPTVKIIIDYYGEYSFIAPDEKFLLTEKGKYVNI